MLFRSPRTIGEYQSQEVVANIGRFGPYIKYGEAFISIPRGEDPLEITLGRAVELIQEKQQADAPIALFDSLPVTKGKGRFGPYLKWNDLFINVPKKYDFDHLSKSDIDELIELKKAKEANRFIRQWPEEKIAIENGRWGPFIRFNKKMLKMGRKKDDSKYAADELQTIGLEEIKSMIIAQVPNAFSSKKTVKAAASRKAAPVKAKTQTKNKAASTAKKAAAPKKPAKRKAPDLKVKHVVKKAGKKKAAKKK